MRCHGCDVATCEDCAAAWEALHLGRDDEPDPYEALEAASSLKRDADAKAEGGGK